MSDWNISKVSPSAATASPAQSESWPSLSTFTVSNRSTGEIRNVTCCGAGLLLDLIGQGRFDEDSAA